jgi:hypothetical protein
LKSKPLIWFDFISLRKNNAAVFGRTQRRQKGRACRCRTGPKSAPLSSFAQILWIKVCETARRPY